MKWLAVLLVSLAGAGIVARWVLLSGRGSRQRAENARAAAAAPPTLRSRILGTAEVPLLAVLAVLVAILAVAVGTLVGPR